MPSPHEHEGGEILQPVEDVWILPEQISKLTAWHAARTALRYAFDADDLPFAEIVKESRDSSRIVRVGVFSPLDYANEEDTIVLNPREVIRSKSFMAAVKALHKVGGKDFAEAGAVYIMVDLDGTNIPLHQDLVDYSRSFIQLAGARYLSFIDERGTKLGDIFGSGVLEPGDAYTMQFWDDEANSVYHAANYSGEPYSVGIYTNRTND